MNENQNHKEYSERQIVIFGLDNEEFGVDISEVREIIKAEKITKIPNTEEYIKGIINLRDKIIVIVSLAIKLGLKESQETKNTRNIVIQTDNTTIGMIVDNCNEVLRIPQNQIEKTPQMLNTQIEHKYIEGVAKLKERLIILLDLTKILHKSELEQIQKITQEQK